MHVYRLGGMCNGQRILIAHGHRLLHHDVDRVPRTLLDGRRVSNVDVNTSAASGCTLAAMSPMLLKYQSEVRCRRSTEASNSARSGSTTATT